MLPLDGFNNTKISEIISVFKGNANVKLHCIRQQLATILNRKLNGHIERMAEYVNGNANHTTK